MMTTPSGQQEHYVLDSTLVPFWLATTVIITAVDGSGREQLVLDSTLVPFWLATMDADDQEPFQIFEKVSPATPIHWYIWCSAPAPLVEQLQLGPLGGLDLVRGGGR